MFALKKASIIGRLTKLYEAATSNLKIKVEMLQPNSGRNSLQIASREKYNHHQGLIYMGENYFLSQVLRTKQIRKIFNIFRKLQIRQVSNLMDLWIYKYHINRWVVDYKYVYIPKSLYSIVMIIFCFIFVKYISTIETSTWHLCLNLNYLCNFITVIIWLDFFYFLSI